MQSIYAFDFGILDFIRENIASPFLDGILSIFTHAGDSGAVWIAIALVLMLIPSKELRRTGFMMAAMLIMVLLINDVFLKHLIARPRPFVMRPETELFIPPPSGYSFPSGHSCSSFGSAAVIGGRTKKKSVRIAVWTAAAIIALSRLYFYVHYPTDVIVGSLLGILYGVICVKAGEKITAGRENASENGGR
ncbi:MAG: phosphatase PAP2 family protein [Ruminococcus sp.]|nr:phosphatase PAP2 family protein [Ruminococcus sp.]